MTVYRIRLTGRAGSHPIKETSVSVAKVIELSARSNESFEQAVKEGIAKANETLDNIEGAWVKEQQVAIENGDIVGYEVNLKVTFVLQ